MQKLDKRDLSGRVAVVTGADSGIGLCFSRELARRHCSVVMVSIRNEELRTEADRVAREFKVKTYPLTLDLCKPDAADIVLNYIDGLSLEADILINNAGVFAFDNVVEMDEKRVNCFVDLHVRAVTQLSRAFVGRMKQKGEGWILNMSSMSCWAPMPGLSMYSATKAYIRVFTRSLHYEMRDSGVGVTVACPGGIATPLFGLPDNLMRLALRLHAVQTPQRFVVKAIDKMLEKKMQYINGLLNRLAIFGVGIAPTSVRMLVKRLMLDKGIRR